MHMFWDEAGHNFFERQGGECARREKKSEFGEAIEYACFGLVWQKFGQEICEGEEIADMLDKKLVSPIDAGDNGVELVEYQSEIKPYFIQNVDFS